MDVIFVRGAYARLGQGHIRGSHCACMLNTMESSVRKTVDVSKDDCIAERILKTLTWIGRPASEKRGGISQRREKFAASKQSPSNIRDNNNRRYQPARQAYTKAGSSAVAKSYDTAPSSHVTTTTGRAKRIYSPVLRKRRDAAGQSPNPKPYVRIWNR